MTNSLFSLIILTYRNILFFSCSLFGLLLILPLLHYYALVAFVVRVMLMMAHLLLLRFIQTANRGPFPRDLAFYPVMLAFPLVHQL
ncbi:hypothetical protein H097_12948 [Pseudomonas sp. FH4]|nr:hypothetical protein H097_12948 [Pseudomonas sp. FH4]